MNSILSNAFARMVAIVALAVFSAVVFQAQVQPQARRLILKDGTYQSVTKYEVNGDRVRYFSAERGEWEELPKALIDWDATDKFEQGRAQGLPSPEAVELDKQVDAERKAEQARSPEVAPGLHLPDGGGMFLLDTYQNQPQLAELQQSGAEMQENTKANIVRSAINPLGGSKQSIELPGPHAKVQAHALLPSIYINVDLNEGLPVANQPDIGSAPPPLPERYKIIRIDTRNGKRMAGSVKIAVSGKMKTDEQFVTTTSTMMTGGWLKLTPTEALATGEYAIAELLGKDGMNLYVWDFGVNPSAPANASTWKADSTDAQPKTDPPVLLQKHDKQ